MLIQGMVEGTDMKKKNAVIALAVILAATAVLLYSSFHGFCENRSG